ncbi:MAG: transposase [Burkholderia sp.]
MIAAFVARLREHGVEPEQITSVSIDMSPVFIKGVETNLPNARITFDTFHVVAHAPKAVDPMRRIEQRTDPELKGIAMVAAEGSRPADRRATRRSRCPDRERHDQADRPARGAIASNFGRFSIASRSTLSATCSSMWCTNVMRSKVNPMKDVARMIRSHFDGTVA